jgi:hypothetical protein
VNAAALGVKIAAANGIPMDWRFDQNSCSQSIQSGDARMSPSSSKLIGRRIVTTLLVLLLVEGLLAIGVLADAVVVPMVQQARERARRMQCSNHLTNYSGARQVGAGTIPSLNAAPPVGDDERFMPCESPPAYLYSAPMYLTVDGSRPTMEKGPIPFVECE